MSLRIGMSINIVGICPECGAHLQNIAKLPMRQHVLMCVNPRCEIKDVRMKIRNGEVVGVSYPQRKEETEHKVAQGAQQ